MLYARAARSTRAESLFFFNYPATPEIYTLSLHDALPISLVGAQGPTRSRRPARARGPALQARSEEHTSELQSHSDLVCRLLLEKKNKHTRAGDAKDGQGRLGLADERSTRGPNPSCQTGSR